MQYLRNLIEHTKYYYHSKKLRDLVLNLVRSIKLRHYCTYFLDLHICVSNCIRFFTKTRPNNHPGISDFSTNFGDRVGDIATQIHRAPPCHPKIRRNPILYFGKGASFINFWGPFVFSWGVLIRGKRCSLNLWSLSQKTRKRHEE